MSKRKNIFEIENEEMRGKWVISRENKSFE